MRGKTLLVGPAADIFAVVVLGIIGTYVTSLVMYIYIRSSLSYIPSYITHIPHTR